MLRRVARDGFELPADDTPAGAAIRHSHPRWLVDLWWAWLGPEETPRLLEANNRPAEFAIRVNPLVEPDPSRIHIPDGPFDAASHADYRRGAFVVQSTASQLVTEMLDPQPGERVLDLCAAPGNKTTHMAALMGDEGEIVAYERHPGRAEAMRRTCERPQRPLDHRGRLRRLRRDRELRPRPAGPALQRARDAPSATRTCAGA